VEEGMRPLFYLSAMSIRGDVSWLPLSKVALQEISPDLHVISQEKATYAIIGE
jgi:hypothetical protein